MGENTYDDVPLPQMTSAITRQCIVLKKRWVKSFFWKFTVEISEECRGKLKLIGDLNPYWMEDAATTANFRRKKTQTPDFLLHLCHYVMLIEYLLFLFFLILIGLKPVKSHWHYLSQSRKCYWLNIDHCFQFMPVVTVPLFLSVRLRRQRRLRLFLHPD